MCENIARLDEAVLNLIARTPSPPFLLQPCIRSFLRISSNVAWCFLLLVNCFSGVKKTVANAANNK